MDYERIKDLAKIEGKRIDDLLALAPGNDPFYTGRPAEIAAARWFADLLQSSGLDSVEALHLRRVHYRLVAAADVLMPTGAAYENTDSCWKYLCNAGKYARVLGYVNEDSFVDRRNPDPIINVTYTGDSNEPDYSVQLPYGLPLPPSLPKLSIPDFEIDWPRLSADSYDPRQYHVEVWAEKTTMNDELMPICGRYRVNLITGMGEMSWPAVLNFLKRVKRSSMPARILYISDYDPAGLGMPISIARKIEFAQYNRPEFTGLDVRLQPIILTADQVQQYDLPRTPVKDTDLRKDNWQSTHGQGAVELDALEALRPGTFADIVARHIRGYRDSNLIFEARRVEEAFQEYLDQVAEKATAEMADEKATIAAEYAMLFEKLTRLRDDLNTAVEPYRAALNDHAAQLNDLNNRASSLRQRIEDALDAADVDTTDYEMPWPDLPAEDGMLFASGRDYFSQLDWYKTYREYVHIGAAASTNGNGYHG